MKRLFLSAVVVLSVGLLAGCSGGSSKPFKSLADVYAEIGTNNKKVTDFTQSLNNKSLEERTSGQADALELMQEVTEQNKALLAKAREEADKMAGSKVKCEATGATGISNPEAVVEKVAPSAFMASVWVKVSYQGTPATKLGFVLQDANDKVIFRNMAANHEGYMLCNFNITATKDPEAAKMMAEVVKITIVSEEEFHSGNIGTAATEAQDGPAVVEKSDISSGADASILDGSAIKEGLPLAETIRKAGKVSWDYGVDNGLYCNFGKVSLVIGDDDITAEGLDKLNALVSDINVDIDFSADYIKPSAKIRYFEIQQ